MKYLIGGVGDYEPGGHWFESRCVESSYLDTFSDPNCSYTRDYNEITKK